MTTKEQRWSVRQPIQLNVTLYHSVGRPIPGKVQDISFGGIYVETNEKIPPVNTPVALGFRYGDGSNDNYYRMSAIVIRSTGAGAGLMFEKYDDSTVESLERVYQKAVI